jgi:hypothetical protein
MPLPQHANPRPARCEPVDGLREGHRQANAPVAGGPCRHRSGAVKRVPADEVRREGQPDAVEVRPRAGLPAVDAIGASRRREAGTPGRGGKGSHDAPAPIHEEDQLLCEGDFDPSASPAGAGPRPSRPAKRRSRRRADDAVALEAGVLLECDHGEEGWAREAIRDLAPRQIPQVGET